MSYVLGIDVGTTRTSAAVAQLALGPADIEVVNLGDRSSAVPSVLYLGDDGTVVVGDAAERRAVSDSEHVVREFKRRIGDPTPIVVGGRSWAPEELSAYLARWVVDRVSQREGGPANRVSVTHPASWGTHKKELLGAALAKQGLSVMFLAEPQAAALHYASTERLEPGSTIAVYDLGGGTFDAAVVHKDPAGTFSLKGRPEGLERLGGVDFDDIVFEHVRAAMPEAFAALDEDDPAALAAVAAVRRDCREAKEALSSDTEVAIPVLMPGSRGSVRLHRSEFEAMIRPQVEETVTALRRAITSAGYSPEQLTAVLLVGGSSRIPLVGELVSQQLGRPVAVDTDPKNAIAKGAALALMPAGVSRTGSQVPAPRSGNGARHPLPAGVPAPFLAGTGTHLPRNPTGAMPPPQRSAAMPVRASAGPPSGSPSGSPSGPPPAPTQIAFPERPAVGGYESAYEGYDDVDEPAYGGNRGGGYGPERGGYGPVYDREYAAPTGRPPRSPALLVSAGGGLAAVAIVAVAFLLPHGPQTAAPAGQITTVSVAPPPTPTPTPTPEPAPPTTTKKREPVVPRPAPVTTPPTPTVTVTVSASATPTVTTSPTKSAEPSSSAPPSSSTPPKGDAGGTTNTDRPLAQG